MHRILLPYAALVLSLNAQTLKIVVQNPAVMKELQTSGEIPAQVKLVTAKGADLTREIADADGFIATRSSRYTWPDVPTRITREWSAPRLRTSNASPPASR
jgi:hypothetical protein